MSGTLRKISNEVFFANDPVVRVDAKQVAFIKQQASASPRRRARICAHRSNDNPLHEMLIVLSAGSYIHPHKHIDKSESFHIIEGEVDVVLFDQTGAIVDVIEMGDFSSGKDFYYRLADDRFHTLLIRSDFLIMHEVTNGPFDATEDRMAAFAPPESRYDEAMDYLDDVARRAAAFRLQN